eukprot:5265447-Prymnesium_polylepis.1
MVCAGACPTQGNLHAQRQPAVRLDVYDHLLNPVIPASGDATGGYPPFAPERMNTMGTLGSGLIVDRVPGMMQGWFRSPQDSQTGTWWTCRSAGW